jgi:microfibrillar-associated protein 1
VEQEIKKEFVDEVNELLATVDDTDGLDPEQEYEDWKKRELFRLHRDYETRIAWDKEQQEIERRRNMTVEERKKEEEEVRQKNLEAQQNKPKMKFLQKYYHKGAFYVEEDLSLLSRNYNEATGEDHFNREVLPEVLQKRNFGKSGQTKWTHLANEDTSSKDAGWNAERHILKGIEKKRGGMGNIDRVQKRKR